MNHRVSLIVLAICYLTLTFQQCVGAQLSPHSGSDPSSNFPSPVIEEITPIVDRSSPVWTADPSLMAIGPTQSPRKHQAVSIALPPSSTEMIEASVSKSAMASVANISASHGDTKSSASASEKAPELLTPVDRSGLINGEVQNLQMVAQEHSRLLFKNARQREISIAASQIITDKKAQASAFRDALQLGLRKVPPTILSEAQKIVAALKLDRILNDANVKTAQIVSVNLQTLATMAQRDGVTRLCNGKQIFCRKVRNSTGWKESSSNAPRMFVTLEPQNQNEPIGNALFVKKGNSSIGVLNVGASTFTITPLANTISVITTSSNTALDRNRNDVATIDPAQVRNPALSAASSKAVEAAMKSDDDCPNPKETQIIDLLVSYTAKAKTEAYNDGKDIELLADFAQALSNTSFEQSNINGRVRIIGKMETSYVESGDFSKDVDELTQPKGVLKKVHDERRRIKADIVVLIINDENAGNCGIAKQIGATKETAYVVVNWQCLTDRFSFIHEIGHLAGAWHDPAALGGGYNITPSYASGYITTGNHPVATIMAYPSSCPKPCGRDYYWADPFIKNQYGDPLGTVTQNFDACIWRRRLETMAKFDGG